MDPLAYARNGVADQVTYTPTVMRTIAADPTGYPGYRVEVGGSGAVRMWFGDRRVVPEGSAGAVLRKLYEDPATGLFGRDRMFDRVKRSYVGISKRDVEAFVKARKEAQIHAPVRRQRIRSPIVTRAPFERWQVDLVDVSSLRAANGGVLYLLTVIDCFSKYAWAVPLKRKTAESLAAAVKVVFADAEREFGGARGQKGTAPQTLQSDNGTEFRGEFRGALREAGVGRHVTSLPYHPQSQGQIERFNGTLKRLIRKAATSTGSTSFLPLLPKLLANYNGSMHGTTRCTPMDVMTGKCSPEAVYAATVRRTRADMSRGVVKHSPVSVGDKVRVLNDVLPATAARRFAQASKRNPAAKHVPNWSSAVFTVSAVRAPAGVYADLAQQLVWLKDETGEELERMFRRDELLALPEGPVQERRDTRPTPAERAMTRPPEVWATEDERAGRGLAVPRDVRAQRARTRAVAAAEDVASRPSTRSRAPRKPSTPEPESEEDEDEQYEVEAVRDHRGRIGSREYLVKWAGWPESDNSWVAESDFAGRAPIDAYWQQQTRPSRR